MSKAHQTLGAAQEAYDDARETAQPEIKMAVVAIVWKSIHVDEIALVPRLIRGIMRAANLHAEGAVGIRKILCYMDYKDLELRGTIQELSSNSVTVVDWPNGR